MTEQEQDQETVEQPSMVANSTQGFKTEKQERIYF